MGEWIFIYKEAIKMEVQWFLFLSSSQLNSGDLGLILPKLANGITSN